jgi:hypothetical protein
MALTTTPRPVSRQQGRKQMKTVIAGIVLLLVGVVPLTAARRVGFVAVAGSFGDETVMRTDYHPATPATSETVCEEKPSGYRTKVVCKTVSQPGTEGFNTESVARLVRQGTVTGNGYTYTVTCAANWSGSKCASLTAGSSYEVEVDNSTMWISFLNSNNRNRLTKAKYSIIGMTPNVAVKPLAATSAPQTPSAAAIVEAERAAIRMQLGLRHPLDTPPAPANSATPETTAVLP